MAIAFITGSTDGLGRAAAESLLHGGHRVVLHARSTDRAAGIGELASRAAGIAIGDLRRAGDVRSIADQVNAIGRMDAIIHNAGVYPEAGNCLDLFDEHPRFNERHWLDEHHWTDILIGLRARQRLCWSMTNQPVLNFSAIGRWLRNVHIFVGIERNCREKTKQLQIVKCQYPLPRG